MNPATASLGAHRATFLPKSASLKVVLGSAGVALLVSLLSFSMAVGRLLGDAEALSSRFGRDRILIGASLGAFSLLTAAVLAALYYTQKKSRVDLYAEGFAHTNWRKSLAFRWDEITEVYARPVHPQRTAGGGGHYHSRRVINWIYTVHGNDGQVAKFGGLENIGRLGAIIQTESAKRLLPRAIETFEASGRVEFGPKLSLSQEGVAVRADRLPWAEVAGVKVDHSGAVTVLKKGKRLPWKFIGGHAVANPVVLRALLKACGAS